jgi:hypothetical protein
MQPLIKYIIAISCLVSVQLNTIAQGSGSGKLPAPKGKYPVGTREFHLKDLGRLDPIQGDRRDILLQVWYPCKITSQEKMSYAPDKRLVDYFIKNQYYGVDTLILKKFYDLKTNSYKNSAILDKGKMPVLLFVPGWGTSRVNYTSMYEALAS